MNLWDDMTPVEQEAATVLCPTHYWEFAANAVGKSSSLESACSTFISIDVFIQDPSNGVGGDCSKCKAVSKLL